MNMTKEKTRHYETYSNSKPAGLSEIIKTNEGRQRSYRKPNRPGTLEKMQ